MINFAKSKHTKKIKNKLVIVQTWKWVFCFSTESLFATFVHFLLHLIPFCPRREKHLTRADPINSFQLQWKLEQENFLNYL